MVRTDQYGVGGSWWILGLNTPQYDKFVTLETKNGLRVQRSGSLTVKDLVGVTRLEIDKNDEGFGTVKIELITHPTRTL